MEKLNDDCRRVHLQRSNKWDASQMSFLLGNGFSTCHIVNKQQGLTKKGTPTTGKAQLRIAMQSDPMCLHK